MGIAGDNIEPRQAVVDTCLMMVDESFPWPSDLDGRAELLRMILEVLAVRVGLEIEPEGVDGALPFYRAALRGVLRSRRSGWPEPRIDSLLVEDIWRRLRSTRMWGDVDRVGRILSEIAVGAEDSDLATLASKLQSRFARNHGGDVGLRREKVDANELAFIAWYIRGWVVGHAGRLDPVDIGDHVGQELAAERYWEREREQILAGASRAVSKENEWALEEARPPPGFTRQLVTEVLQILAGADAPS